ncbi:MAG TPA: 30S ribosomal protein S5 [Candidatus Pacebacteria bacterium]|nr:30S ribosomal protein S5 [Candidatus Paceibacterota bacterium]
MSDQRRSHQEFEERSEFEEKVISISRVSKKTKGGNKMGFSVLMVVGDRKGQVGLGLGKANDVASAIKKGIRKAKKKMLLVPLDGTTIPFALTLKEGAGKVMLKPAPTGTGVIAGGPVRAVVEAAGIRDISGKIMGSDNQSSSVYATFAALKKIAQIVKVKNIKLRSIIETEAEEKEKMQKLQQTAKQHEAVIVKKSIDSQTKSRVGKPAKSVKSAAVKKLAAK